MKTKKRFFLKAAGISPVKGAGISLALVIAFALMFAMAFAACDTGTSSSRTPTEDEDTGGGGGGGNTVVPVETPYRDSSGNYVLTITESGGAVSYRLVYAGTQVSYGTVTKGTSAWTFSSYYTEEIFTLYVSVGVDGLIFTGSPTITADDGTTRITIPTLSVTGSSGDSGDTGGGGGGGSTDTGTTVKDEATLRTALDKTDDNGNYIGGVYRITSSNFELKEDLAVHAGQHIVVGGSYQSGEDVAQYSAGGPLFVITGTTHTFNIGARLRLEKGEGSTSGATLSIERGAAVNVTNGGVLYAEGDTTNGAKVGVGVNVSRSNPAVFEGSSVSNLWIAGGGALHVASGATLAVTNNPSRSKVKLETATSALTLEKDAELRIEVTAALATNEAGAVTAEAEADRIIGDSTTNVIEIAAPNAPAAIGEVAVKGYEVTTIASDIEDEVNGAAEEATSESTARTTDEATGPTGVQALLNAAGVTRVTYSGTGALSAVVGSGQTLVISGEVANQTAAISGQGKLEITGSVSLAASVAEQAILKSFVIASGGGKVVLNSTTLTVSGELEVNQTLVIEDGKTLAFDAYGTISDKSTGPIVNKGIISTAQAKIPGADLGEILKRVGGNGGTFEVTAAEIDVASGTLAIPADTTLKLSGTAGLTVATGANLTVEDTATLDVAASATLTNNGTINFNAGSTLTTPVGTIENNGTINTATDDEATLRALVGLTEAASASGTVSWNGASGALVAVTLTASDLTLDTQDLVIGQYATLDLATFALGGSKNVTNNGTVTTTATGVAALHTLFTKVNGNVTASAIEVSDDVTLTVPADTALTITIASVTADKTLTIVLTGNGTISGTVTSNSGTIEAADAATLAKVLLWTGLNGKVAVSGDVDIIPSGTLTIPSGVTLTLAEGQALTASGTIEGTGGSIDATATSSSLVVAEAGGFTLTGGTVTGDVTKVVTGSYTLPTTTESSIETALWGFVEEVPKNHLNSGVPYISRTAKKDLSTENNGVVTIYLTGTVTDTQVGGHSVVDVWFGGKAQAATTLGGKYAIVTIGGILTPAAKAANTEVKHTNPSWAYYTGHDHNATNESEVATAQTQWPWTYINTSNYNASLTYRKYEAAASNDEWILLLWEAPSSINNPAVVKKATLEIKPENETLYKVIVDWTGLTIS